MIQLCVPMEDLRLRLSFLVIIVVVVCVLALLISISIHFIFVLAGPDTDTRSRICCHASLQTELYSVGIDEKTSNAKLADDDVSCEMNKQEMGGRKKTSDLKRIDVKNDR